LFVVTVVRDAPVRVVLGNVDADATHWANAIPVIERAVASKNVRIPDGARGMRFVVRVDAEIRLPDGRRPKDIGTRFVATPGKIVETKESITLEGVPTIGVYHEGKICSAGIGLYPGGVAVGGSCSPENIGQPATRIVHARVVEQSRVD
jgi:hypothetical protein